MAFGYVKVIQWKPRQNNIEKTLFCSRESKYFLEYRIRFIPQCNRYHIPQQVD